MAQVHTGTTDPKTQGVQPHFHRKRKRGAILNRKCSAARGVCRRENHRKARCPWGSSRYRFRRCGARRRARASCVTLRSFAGAKARVCPHVDGKR